MPGSEDLIGFVSYGLTGREREPRDHMGDTRQTQQKVFFGDTISPHLERATREYIQWLTDGVESDVALLMVS